MGRFYDHPDGKLHFEAAAGGNGGGATSAYDGIATEADIRAHPHEHAAYVRAKHAATVSSHSQSIADEKAAIAEKIGELQREVAALPDNA